LDLAIDAPACPGQCVLISHGSGGTPLVYRTLAHFLARHGFIVAIPEHPFNNKDDNSLETSIDNLFYRPRHLQLSLNWLNEKFDVIHPDRAAVIGHSMGGYSALAIAGGHPSTLHQTINRTLAVTHDPRIKATILLAPATVWYHKPDALADVRSPILMFFGEMDEYTPPKPHARIVLENLPKTTPIQSHLIPNAGHFSFLSPFPRFMSRFEIAQDPPGFNRQQFHDNILQPEILVFLRASLGK
jgi:predicted dienelactone hydrolase